MADLFNNEFTFMRYRALEIGGMHEYIVTSVETTTNKTADIFTIWAKTEQVVKDLIKMWEADDRQRWRYTYVDNGETKPYSI